ncbi:TPA: RNA polymerase Rbp10 [Candidatus Bathyarchaeota archaeon]|nr:RNA polymerase Rbp10 [Candidatus Bathyarchaeota archaeon]
MGEEERGGPIYECLRCRATISFEELMRKTEMKCHCGYHVLRKVRPPIVKRVKAI